MAKSWRTKKYRRYGQPWTGGELRALDKMMSSGIHINEVSHKLGRTPESCDSIFRDIRRMNLLKSGGDEDTLKSMRDKKKHGERVRKIR